MTAVEVREKLSKAWKLKREILAKERYLDELRSRAEKMTPSYSDMPKGTEASSRVENLAIQIVEASYAIDEYIIELVKAEAEAEMLIRSEEDAFKRSLLTDYHLNGLTISMIAEQEHYTERRIFQLLAEAYRDIADKIS